MFIDEEMLDSVGRSGIMMWGYPYMGSAMAWMAFWSVIWLVVLGVVIWALVRWASGRTPSASGPSSGPSALEVLRQRYARGEIDSATFEQMRERLEASGTHFGMRAPVG
jgi:putative membrane protein